MALQISYYNHPIKPIIVCQFVGVCHPNDLEQVFDATIKFLELSQAQHIYRISDGTHLGGSIKQIERIFEAAMQHRGGSIMDNRIIPISSGNAYPTQLFRQVLKENPKSPLKAIPMLPDLPSALNFVQNLR